MFPQEVPCSLIHNEAGGSEVEEGISSCSLCPLQHYFLNQEFQNYNVYYTPSGARYEIETQKCWPSEDILTAYKHNRTE